MTLKELLSLNIENKVVTIIGRPGSGKSYLCSRINTRQNYKRKILETDRYIRDQKRFGEAYVSIMINDFNKYCFDTIEGVGAYEMILSGEQAKTFRPDIIIDCVISAGKQREIYLAERNPEKLKWQKKFYEQKLTLLNEYFKLIRELPESERPQFITYNNTFDAVEK